MKFLSAFFISFFLLLGTAQAQKTRTTMSMERGFVTVGLQLGASESRALNPDGTWSGSTGYLYGADLELRFLGEGAGEVRFFGRSSILTEKSRENENNSVHSSVTTLGLKVFATESFYVGAGMTSNVQKFKTAANDFSLSNGGVAAGMGYEFHLGGNFFGSINGWYQANPLKNESPLTGNSFIEGGTLFLSFSWSPPLTIISSTTSR